MQSLSIDRQTFDQEKRHERATANADSKRHLSCSTNEHGGCRDLSSRKSEH